MESADQSGDCGDLDSNKVELDDGGSESAQNDGKDIMDSSDSSGGERTRLWILLIRPMMIMEAKYLFPTNTRIVVMIAHPCNQFQTVVVSKATHL